MNNVRYLTSTHIGTWAQDKANRFTHSPERRADLWDFGSAARHHQLHCPWLGRAVASRHLDAAGRDDAGMGRGRCRQEDPHRTGDAWASKEPVGIDIIEPPFFLPCKRKASRCRWAALMSEARVIKTQDEIWLLNTSAMMVDAALRRVVSSHEPGMSENQAVGLVSKVLYDLGSEYVRQ